MFIKYYNTMVYLLIFNFFSVSIVDGSMNRGENKEDLVNFNFYLNKIVNIGNITKYNLIV